MIDTWLFTALVFLVIALCVILRGIPAKSREDRLVAGTVVLTLVSMAALTAGIALGMFIIPDIFIIIALCGFGFMIFTGKQPGADLP